VESLPVPVLVSGGLRDASSARRAFDESGAAAVLLARGSLGNPWLFAELLGLREPGLDPSREEILAELDWVMECAVEHLGEERATRYLRKFYPWYVERLGGTKADQKALQAALQTAPTLIAARELFESVPA
jgi:tRNA-dihydrouridine synthase